MRGPPVVLTNTLGRPVTNIISERGAVPMVVVNTLGEPVTLVNSGGEPVTLLNPNGTLWDYPFSLFANAEQGAWYDPSDFSTLYQTSTGSTPVTAVEQPVGLMLDRSRGLVLGAELVTNGTFDANVTSWTAQLSASIAWSSGAIEITGSSTNNNGVFQTLTGLTVGRLYVATAIVRRGTCADVVRFGVNGIGDTLTNSTTNVALTFMFVATSTAHNIQVVIGGTASNGQTAYADNISVRELPGNHALQATSTSRPVLRARYNLLTYSEQLDNAAWAKDLGATITANAGVAPDGTTTADRYDRGGTSVSSRMRPATSVQVTTGTSYVLSIFAKAETATIVTFEVGLIASFPTTTFDLSAVTVSGQAGATITPQANGWYRCIMPFTAAGTGSQELRVGSYGSTTGTLLLWGSDLKTAADQTATGGAYQRIAAATDYDTSNPVFRPYLAFDGTDDSLGTSAIDFSNTDEMTVFAGISKLSDAAQAVVVGFGNITQAGAFELFAPTSAAGNDFNFAANGGTTFVQAAAGSRPSPITVVASGVMDFALASGEVITRINGASAATSSGDAGSGNFGNYALQVGRRGGSSLPLNGRLYSLAVLGRTATAAELTSMEAWVNGKTGAF